MAAFFSDLLDSFLEVDFLRKVHKKFHYAPEQMEMLSVVAKEMLPLMEKDAFWERRVSDAQIGGKLSDAKPDEKFERKLPNSLSVAAAQDFLATCSECKYEDVVISLGAGLDELQEDYNRKELLLESYMLETLAGELLLQGYGSYNRYVEGNGTWHVARYHFPGSEEEFPLEMLPKMLQGLTGRIACNTALCMQPKKSVAFVAELTQDAKKYCQGICIGCGSAHCPNRIEDDTCIGRLMRSKADMPLYKLFMEE